MDKPKLTPELLIAVAHAKLLYGKKIEQLESRIDDLEKAIRKVILLFPSEIPDGEEVDFNIPAYIIDDLKNLVQ